MNPPTPTLQTNRLTQLDVSLRRTSRRIHESKQGCGVCADVNEATVGMWRVGGAGLGGGQQQRQQQQRQQKIQQKKRLTG